MLHFLRKLLRKGIRIDLEEPYRYPTDKDFVMADAAVIRAAIEKYASESGQKLSFLRREDPIVFMLNEKETYTAKLEASYTRIYYGYRIHCQEVVE